MLGLGFKKKTPNITNVKKHVKNTQQRITITMLELGLKDTQGIIISMFG